MSRFLVLALCICAATAELVQIGDRFYFFEDVPAAVTWDQVQTLCSPNNMNMVGFETTAEYDLVLTYMTRSGKTGGYWTNGQWAQGTTWNWGGQGSLDIGDIRWAAGEPGNGPWDTEKVAFTVEGRDLWSEDMSMMYNIICEGTQ